MRIDRLTLKNFKKFTDFTIDLNPHFTLLVGENGSGKTSVLDGLAVALGVWLAEIPEARKKGSLRNILPTEIRLQPATQGDRTQFTEQRPVVVEATGLIGETGASQNEHMWTRRIAKDAIKTGGLGLDAVRAGIRDLYNRAMNGEQLILPILSYYGAGRAWLPSNQRKKAKSSIGNGAQRWDAYYDCLAERIRLDDLQTWFRRETTAAGNRGGRMRPGFEAVKRVIIECVPGADAIHFDDDREEIILSINGHAQPFNNLSAGQRMMLALVADIAIKAITLNAFLLPPDELRPEDEPIPRVLAQTPGVVLIDELDVHLHPQWQRRIAHDLKRIFSKIQFVCTSHSPQIIGELKPEEIRILTDEGADQPDRSYGMESGRVLEELMGAPSRNEDVEKELGKLSNLISEDRLEEAKEKAETLEAELGISDPDIVSAKTLVAFLEEEEP